MKSTDDIKMKVIDHGDAQAVMMLITKAAQFWNSAGIITPEVLIGEILAKAAWHLFTEMPCRETVENLALVFPSLDENYNEAEYREYCEQMFKDLALTEKAYAEQRKRASDKQPPTNLVM